MTFGVRWVNWAQVINRSTKAKSFFLSTPTGQTSTPCFTPFFAASCVWIFKTKLPYLEGWSVRELMQSERTVPEGDSPFDARCGIDVQSQWHLNALCSCIARLSPECMGLLVSNKSCGTANYRMHCGIHRRTKGGMLIHVYRCVSGTSVFPSVSLTRSEHSGRLPC